MDHQSATSEHKSGLQGDTEAQRVWLQKLRCLEHARPAQVEATGERAVALLFQLQKMLERRVVEGPETQHVSSRVFLPDLMPQYLLAQNGELTTVGKERAAILATGSSRRELAQAGPDKTIRN